MDTVTHTLFGLTIYGAVDKRKMEKNTKRAFLFTSIVGSQIPDIDFVSRWWDTEGMYQMWHRGVTHSLFMVPIWALLLWFLCMLIWKTKDRRLFYVGLLAVFIHSTSDLFNAWGTGYLEPFSSVRITFGTISIIDFVFWGIMLCGYLIVRFQKKIKNSFLHHMPKHTVYRFVWGLIALHVMVQSFQGYMIYQKMEPYYERHALAASFVPWNFTVIGKVGDQVELRDAVLWKESTVRDRLTSAEDADLTLLFEQNPKAKTLYEWSPFVVIVDDQELLGVYDPRFYQNGQSFLFEYIEKHAD